MTQPNRQMHINLHAMISVIAKDRLDTYQSTHGFSNRSDALDHLLLSMLPVPEPINEELL